MERSEAVAALAALAQDTRLSVYRALVQASLDGLTAGAIAQEVQVAPATLSFHLKTLHHAGLVRYEQRGRHVQYYANYERMSTLLAYLTDNCCAGDNCSLTDPVIIPRAVSSSCC